jgi:glutaredoxin 3
MAAAKVVIYTKSYCPYCVRAKYLLNKKGAAYEEIDVTNDPATQEAMSQRAEGRKTVPQIFINDKPIGGCDDLYALDAKGELDKLLGLA